MGVLLFIYVAQWVALAGWVFFVKASWDYDAEKLPSTKEAMYLIFMPCGGVVVLLRHLKENDKQRKP